MVTVMFAEMSWNLNLSMWVWYPQEIGKVNKNESETYITVWVSKHLSDMFPNKNGLKQGGALSPLLFVLFWSMPLVGFR